MLKLAYIANARIPTEKAHGYQITKMCEVFASKGVSVELILPTRKNHIKDDIFNFYGLKRNFKFRKIHCFDFIGYFPEWGRLSFWLQNIFFAISILFLYLEKDVIYYSRSAVIVLILRLRRREVYFESHRLLNSKWIYRYLLGKNIKIISLTQASKNEYIKMGLEDSNILVSPDSVDLDVFGRGLSVEEARRYANLPIDKKIIGYFGSFKTMGEDKGLLDVIKILSKLPENIIFLAVGGLGAEIDYYEKQALKIAGEGKVIFLKTVERSKLPPYEESCDILLMPFPDTIHYRLYMSPLKMFEYMASKRPIITTDLPSVREVLDDSSAVFVPPRNSDKLTEAIKYLLDNRNKGEELSQNAFLKVKNYTWEKRVERILEFILQRRHPHQSLN